MKALRIVLVSLFALGLSGLYAQEFGLNLDTSVQDQKTTTTNVTFKEIAGLWAKTDLGTWGSFKANGTVNYENQSASGAYTGLWANLELFKLTLGAANPQKSLSGFAIGLGRDVMADPTGLVFSNSADGLTLDFGFNNVAADFKFGYTGLVSRLSSNVLMSAADQATISGDDYLGPPRFVSMADFLVPDLGGQSLTLSFLVQQDMNKSRNLVSEGTVDYEPGVGGFLDTQYATVQLAGPIYGNLFHSSFFTYGMGRELDYLKDSSSATGYSYSYSPLSSWLAGTKLSYYLPSFFSSVFSFRTLVASGGNDASLSASGKTSSVATAFVPVTTTTLGAVFSPRLSDLAFFELGMSAKPLSAQEFQGILKAMTFFRTSTGLSALPGVTGSKSYLGTEVDLSAIYRIFSDLGVSLTTGVFLPGVGSAGAFDANYEKLQYSAKLDVSLSL
jgi:hypothetical protein